MDIKENIIAVDLIDTRIREQCYSCSLDHESETFTLDFYVIDVSDEWLAHTPDIYREMDRMSYFKKEKLSILGIKNWDMAGFGIYPKKAYCFSQEYSLDGQLLDFSISKRDDVRSKNYHNQNVVQALCDDESSTLKNIFLMAQTDDKEKKRPPEEILHHFAQDLTYKAIMTYVITNDLPMFYFDYSQRHKNGTPHITRMKHGEKTELPFSAPIRKPATDINLDQLYHYEMTGEYKHNFTDLILMTHEVDHFNRWHGVKEVTELEIMKRMHANNKEVSAFLENMTESEYTKMVDAKAKSMGIE